MLVVPQSVTKIANVFGAGSIFKMPFDLISSRWPKQKRAYEALPVDEQDQESPSHDNRPGQQGHKWDISGQKTMNFFIATATSILSLILILLVTLPFPTLLDYQDSAFPILHSSDMQSHFLTAGKWNYTNPSPCGLSPESARQAGCKWSAMTFAWYPVACYDEELDREFMDLQDWHWYSTEDLKQEDELPRDAVLRGDIRRAFMSMHYHKVHCMYSVRKLYRSLMGKALCDNYILRLGHLEHCEKFMLRDDHPAVKGIYALVFSAFQARC